MEQYIKFSLTCEGQEIVVRYRHRYFSAGYDHFEFMSPYQPARSIPISETGYRSHFAPTQEVEAAPDFKAYAQLVLDALAEELHPTDRNQLTLF